MQSASILRPISDSWTIKAKLMYDVVLSKW